MQNGFNKILKKFLIWRIRHISDKRFVLILSVVIGFLAGLAAVVIKNLVHVLKHLLTQSFAVELHNYLFFVYPAIGILWF